MSTSKEQNVARGSSGAIGFSGLLTLLFIALKLCKVIDWSWWWVLAPVWISIGIVLVIVVVAVLVTVIPGRIKKKKKTVQ